MELCLSILFRLPSSLSVATNEFLDDLNIWPLEKVLSEEGLAQFGDTFGFLVNEPFRWND